MTAYENQRIHFDKLLKRYLEYVELYRFFNHGSVKGVSKFAEYYWLHHYFYKHKRVTGLGNRSAI